MTKEELEKEAKKLFDKKPSWYAMKPELEIYADGFKEGYNKAMKEWRDCFMSCSSPYCADKFRDIQCGGILGNMTKEVKMGEAKQKFNAISAGVDEYIMSLEDENRKLRDKNKALERYADLCEFSALEDMKND